MERNDVIAQLESEWEELCLSPVTAQTFRGLQRAELAIAELDDLDDLHAVMAARDERSDLDRHDQVLLALLRQAQQRTPQGALAARITLQLLLPGVKARCCTARLARLEPQERAGVLLASLYGEIRAPQSPWKPTKVGAQVLGRAYQRLRGPRGIAGHVRTFAYADLDAVYGCRPIDETGRTHPGVEVLKLLVEAVAESRLTREKARLIAAVRVAGISIEEMAHQLGISYAAAAQRLHRAELELRRSISQAM